VQYRHWSQKNAVITVHSNNTRDIISSHHIMGSSVAASSDDEFYYELVKTANTFSMPDSALARAALTEAWPSQAKLDDYRCISLMYDSFSGGSDEDLKAVHDCLEKSVQRGNAPLDNYGALAANYLEKARRHEGLGSDEMFDKARLIIENTSGDWVHSAELTIANIYYEVQRPDFNAERLDSLLYDAETSFNTNPQVLLMVAWRYGYSLGKWEEAKNISDRVKRMYPIRDQSVFIIDAGYALMNSEGDTLMDACKRTYAENSVYINVIVNACARKAKNFVWYNATEENLRKLNAAGIEEKMEVFNSTKYDLQFSSNLKKFLEMGEDI